MKKFGNKDNVEARLRAKGIQEIIKSRTDIFDSWI